MQVMMLETAVESKKVLSIDISELLVACVIQEEEGKDRDTALINSPPGSSLRLTYEYLPSKFQPRDGNRHPLPTVP